MLALKRQKCALLAIALLAGCVADLRNPIYLSMKVGAADSTFEIFREAAAELGREIKLWPNDEPVPTGLPAFVDKSVILVIPGTNCFPGRGGYVNSGSPYVIHLCSDLEEQHKWGLYHEFGHVMGGVWDHLPCEEHAVMSWAWVCVRDYDSKNHYTSADIAAICASGNCFKDTIN